MTTWKLQSIKEREEFIQSWCNFCKKEKDCPIPIHPSHWQIGKSWQEKHICTEWEEMNIKDREQMWEQIDGVAK